MTYLSLQISSIAKPQAESPPSKLRCKVPVLVERRAAIPVLLATQFVAVKDVVGDVHAFSTSILAQRLLSNCTATWEVRWDRLSLVKVNRSKPSLEGTNSNVTASDLFCDADPQWPFGMQISLVKWGWSDLSDFLVPSGPRVVDMLKMVEISDDRLQRLRGINSTVRSRESEVNQTTWFNEELLLFEPMLCHHPLCHPCAPSKTSPVSSGVCTK